MYRLLLILFAVSLLVFACNNDTEPQQTTVVPTADAKEMDSIAAQIVKARTFFDNGDTAQSMRFIDAILKKYPGQLDALSLKAEILKAGGKTAEAIAVLEKAYALQPRDKETAYNLAYEYADTKNAKVLPLTDTLLKYDKTETAARAWYIKATYHNKLGNLQEAYRYYDSATITDYHFLDAYLDKGQLLYKQKQYGAALKTFTIAQRISPATADFYYWLGMVQEALGKKAEAKENYLRAYGLDKSLTEAREAADNIN